MCKYWCRLRGHQLQTELDSSVGALSCAGQEAISWADLIVLAAKVAHVQSWTAQKVKRASIAQDGSTIAEAFGAAFPVPLGRVDATSPDAPVQVPTQSASPAEVKVSYNIEETVAIGRFGWRCTSSACCRISSCCAFVMQTPYPADVQITPSDRQAGCLCVTSCSLFSCLPGQHKFPCAAGRAICSCAVSF